MWIGKNGDRYDGEYKNDKKCGLGIYQFASGFEYNGEFLNDKRHGLGELKLQDGSIEKGEWNQGFLKTKRDIFYPE